MEGEVGREDRAVSRCTSSRRPLRMSKTLKMAPVTGLGNPLINKFPGEGGREGGREKRE
jgi:hypothetical protein